jgi:CheY-like chemotaxis protein
LSCQPAANIYIYMKQLTSPSKPQRILVVDDEPWYAMPLCYSLEAEGFQVSQARTGGEAFDKIRIPVERPDLVILDVMMAPGMLTGDIDARRTGIAVLRKIRSELNLSSKELPVICLTAVDEGAHQEIEELQGEYRTKQSAGITEIITLVKTLVTGG